MFVGDDYVFIHMFRMAGTSCIEQNNMGMVGYHLPHSLLPRELENLPVIGNIRNPFDWYVSVYQHCLHTAHPEMTGTFLNFLLDFKKYNLNESVQKLVDTSWMTTSDKNKALRHFPSFYDWDNARLDNLRKEEFNSYLNGDTGFLTWLFNYMYAVDGSTDKVSFCRLENLQEDWFKNTGQNLSNIHYNSYNDSPGCSENLNAETVALIKKRDKNYMLKFYSNLL